MTAIKFKVRVKQTNALGPVNLGGGVGAPATGAAAVPFSLTNLISYWKLDEASGTRVDSHGTNDLTDNNTVTQSAGKLGNAAQFVAANSEYLNRADNASLSMGAGVRMTLTAWVYADSLTGVDTHEIIGKRNAIDSLEYSLRTDESDLFSFFVTSDGTVGTITLVTAEALSTATWYFVVAWYDGTNINLQVNNGTIHSTAFSADIFDGTSEFDIGAVASLLPGWSWDGRIDSVGLWKRVLTADERAALYNAGAGTEYPF